MTALAQNMDFQKDVFSPRDLVKMLCLDNLARDLEEQDIEFEFEIQVDLDLLDWMIDQHMVYREPL